MQPTFPRFEPARLISRAAIVLFAVGAGMAEAADDVASPSTDDGPRADTSEALLKEVTLPDGFEATIFAAPPAVNYPVFVAASPNGDLYVSVDKNSSLDRGPDRGSVVRLRDVDGDGKADEATKFAPNIDSPRGLVWDHDRLYLMHPPHLSALIDRDGDGVAEEQKVLVKNIAFTFKDRPADHTSNGVTLGIDGWLYLAIGDFGFMEAEGADGRKLQLRGGGVVRVRPDGSGLEQFSRGTRNILEVSLDPLLNAFTRDNTNDGGGWDIRLHHFTGFEHHGYPTLFKNFNDEIIAPLADYGGGSGCGNLYLSEPGFPDGFSDVLYTADWGREIIYRHQLTPNGATFTADQSEFAKLPRVTDLDVDAMSRLYMASWKGAMYKYVGENIGFIVQARPKGYKPEPLPRFDAISKAELIVLFDSPSHRRRLAAQRALLRRGLDEASVAALKKLAKGPSHSLASRVAALYALKQGLKQEANAILAELSTDESLRPLAIRALTDRWDELEAVPTAPILDALTDEVPRTRLEAAVSLARLDRAEYATALARLLADADPVVAHTAVQSLIKLRAADACFAIVDSTDPSMAAKKRALHVLQGLHELPVVDGLLDRLARETDPSRRHAFLIALCRLHFKDGTWSGNSWGTRPDTRGPYYQLQTWAGSERIATALKAALAESTGAESTFLINELNRHRVHFDEVLRRMIALAEQDATLIPATVLQLTQGERIPSEAVPLLMRIVEQGGGDAQVRMQAMTSLLKSAHPDAFGVVLAAMAEVKSTRENFRNLRPLREALLKPRLLEVHFDLLTENAEQVSAAGAWADAGLLVLSDTTDASPETRDSAMQSLEAGWASTPRRVQILQAMTLANRRVLVDKVQAATEDADPAVANAARQVVRRWRFRGPTGPAIKTLEPDAALAAVIRARGNRTRGEAIYTRLECAKCHTVKAGEPLRGPYLPNVVKTYKRPQLAEAILQPSKTIAQGFVTNVFILEDGRTVTGFVTAEADDQVTIRDAEGTEIKIPTNEIEQRGQQKISMMPEGQVNELTVIDVASLIAYLESLAE